MLKHSLRRALSENTKRGANTRFSERGTICLFLFRRTSDASPPRPVYAAWAGMRSHTHIKINYMKKVKIKFPQMLAEVKEIEITNSEFDELKHLSSTEKATLIEKYLSEREKQHIPGDLSAAVEYGYAGIFAV